MKIGKKQAGLRAGRALLGILAVIVVAGWPARAAEEGAGLSVGKNFDVTPGLEKGSQRWPAVAAGKGCYLVVWQEGEALAGVKDTNIFAARVSLDGKALDLKGIPVCAAKALQAYPAATFDGVNFLVAWQDYRTGVDWDIYLARVSQDGKVLDPDGIPVAAIPGNQVQPALASDGKSSHLLVWSDLRPQPPGKPEGCYGVSGTFIRDGKPAEAGGRELVPPKGNSCTDLAARWNGESFVVAGARAPQSWTQVGPFSMKVLPDGKTETLQANFQAQSYALAADPATGRTLFWSTGWHGHGAYHRFYFASLPGAATYLAVGLRYEYGPANGFATAAAFDGKNFVAVVEQPPPKKEGQPADVHREGQPMNIVALRVDPATARPLDTGAVDWSRGGNLERDERIGEAMKTAKPGILVASEPVSERHPALASPGGGRSLLVYSRRGGPDKYKIHAVLLSE